MKRIDRGDRIEFVKDKEMTLEEYCMRSGSTLILDINPNKPLSEDMVTFMHILETIHFDKGDLIGKEATFSMLEKGIIQSTFFVIPAKSQSEMELKATNTKLIKEVNEAIARLKPIEEIIPDNEEDNITSDYDRLDLIWNAQCRLMQKYGLGDEVILAMSEERKTEMLSKVIYAAMRECCEINDELNWKWWRKSRKEVNIHKLREEAIDLLHFCLEICKLVGMNAGYVFQTYMWKNKINHKRMDEELKNLDKNRF